MVFMGAAGGTFTGPTVYAPGGGPVAVGDFNGDSDPDLATPYQGSIRVLLGAAGGSFVSQPPHSCSCNGSIAIADLNGDTDPELAVIDSSGVGPPGRVRIMIGATGGTFIGSTPFPTASDPSSVAVADFNADSALDLVTANSFGGNVSILLAGTQTVSVTNDVTHVEGNSGPTAYDFTVSLTAPSTDPVSVDYHTEDRTATAPPDYFAASGTLNFTPGETSKVVTVYSNGDTSFEPDEDFKLVISNPMFTSIVDDTGVGTILDDGDQAGYVRPLAASPVSVPLVVAYAKCNAPNRVHGPPLEYQSCNPPVPLSQYLTVGTFDANGADAKAVGSVRYRAIPGAPGTADEADIALTSKVSDVRGKITLGDYLAELWTTVTVRLTDRVADRQTVSDFQFGFAVPCTATADTTIGATCLVSTTADAVLPGAVPEGKRSMWQLGQVQVQDGGEDGEGSTIADNTPFLKQGIFVP
jgi:hypothetical protein